MEDGVQPCRSFESIEETEVAEEDGLLDATELDRLPPVQKSLAFDVCCCK